MANVLNNSASDLNLFDLCEQTSDRFYIMNVTTTCTGGTCLIIVSAAGTAEMGI